MNQNPGTEDARDVCEYIVATFLGAVAVIFAGFLGKKYLDVDCGKNETFHINLNQRTDDPNCDCKDCKSIRKAEKKARKAFNLTNNSEV